MCIRDRMEAGRSLGLSKWQTMRKIILPQAVKHILPTYTNEFIVLIKELSLIHILVDLFPDKMLPLHNPKLNAVTLRDLLTMQVGIKFNELGSVVEKDWARGFMPVSYTHLDVYKRQRKGYLRCFI